jgi:predicted transcriptional regulator
VYLSLLHTDQLDVDGIAEASGMSPQHVAIALRRMFDDGRVEHDGWAQWRAVGGPQTHYSASDNNERDPAQSTRAGAVVGPNELEAS